jgi:hypothetical protein
VLVAGVDPIARGTFGAVDAAWSNGMAGRSGAVRIGDTATAEFRYSGYLAYQRLFAIPYGAQAAIRNPRIGLPYPHGDVRTVGSIASVSSTLRNSTQMRARR